MPRQSRKEDPNQRKLAFEGDASPHDERTPAPSEADSPSKSAPQTLENTPPPRIKPPKPRSKKGRDSTKDTFDFMNETIPFHSALTQEKAPERDFAVSQSQFLGKGPLDDELPTVDEIERARMLSDLIDRYALTDLDISKFKLFPKQHALIDEVTGTGRSYMLSAAPGFGKTPFQLVQALHARSTKVPELQGASVYISPLKKLTSQSVKSFQDFTVEDNPLNIHMVDGDVDKDKKSEIYKSAYDVLAVVEKTAIVDFLEIFTNLDIKNVFIDEPQKMTSSKKDPCIIEIVSLIREHRPDICIHYVSGTLTKSQGKDNIKIELRSIAEHLGGVELYYVDRDGEEAYERPDIKIRSCKPSVELRSAAVYYRQLAVQCRNEVIQALDKRRLMKFVPPPKNFEPSVAEFVKLKKLSEPLGLAGRCMQGIGYVQKHKRGMYVGGYPLLSSFFRDYSKRFFDAAFPYGGKLPNIGEIHKRRSGEDPYSIHEGIAALAEDGPYGHLIGKSSWAEVHEATEELRRKLEESIRHDEEQRGIRLDPCSRIRRERMKRYHKRLRSHLSTLAKQGMRITDTIYRDSVYASIFHDTATQTIARGERSDHPKLEKLFDIFDEFPRRFQESPSLVFVNDRSYVDIVVARINHLAGDRGFRAVGLHSGYGSPLCRKIIDSVNDGHYNILVSPLDSIGTGTHIPNVDTVVLYNLLVSSPNSIVQGIKRAGRSIGMDTSDALHLGLTVEGSPEERWIENSFPRHEDYRQAVREVGKEIRAKYQLSS